MRLLPGVANPPVAAAQRTSPCIRDASTPTWPTNAITRSAKCRAPVGVASLLLSAESTRPFAMWRLLTALRRRLPHLLPRDPRKGQDQNEQRDEDDVRGRPLLATSAIPA
jgi:hypothetical protein